VIRAVRIFDDHVRLAVRLTPGSSRDSVDGIESDAAGDVWLKTRVTSVPEKGLANKALIALLAKSLRIPKSDISVISGDTSRKKSLRIDGNPEALLQKFPQFL